MNETRKETKIRIGKKDIKVVCKGVEPSDMPMGLVKYIGSFAEFLKSKSEPVLYVYRNRATLYVSDRKEYNGKLITGDRLSGIHVPQEFNFPSPVGTTPKGLALWYADAVECPSLNKNKATVGVIVSKGADKKGSILTKKTLMSKINSVISK